MSLETTAIANPRPCGRCTSCRCFGYCEEVELPIITDEMLSNSAWLRDARNFASSLGIPGALWPNEIFDLWRDAPLSAPEDFPIERIFLPPDDADGEQIRRFTNALRDWCEYFLNGPEIPECKVVRVRRERREHAKVVLALLAAHYPTDFSTWGRR